MAKRILIVDDDPNTCELIGMELAHKQYEVVATACGEEALKLIDSENFDLLLVDVFIPRVCGEAILDQVRNSRPGAKVVMITGMGDDQLWIHLMNKGASDVIAKPFRPNQLAGVVERVLGASNLGARN